MQTDNKQIHSDHVEQLMKKLRLLYVEHLNHLFENEKLTPRVAALSAQFNFSSILLHITDSIISNGAIDEAIRTN